MQSNCVDKQFCDKCNEDQFLKDAYDLEGTTDENGFTRSFMLNLCADHERELEFKQQ